MTFSPLRVMLGKLRFVFVAYASGDFSPLRVMLGKLRFVFAEYVSGDFFTAPSNARKTASCVTLSRFEKPNYPASSNVVDNVSVCVCSISLIYENFGKIFTESQEQETAAR